MGRARRLLRRPIDAGARMHDLGVGSGAFAPALRDADGDV
jgi:hypothetical protein